jgi:hypothetical protein
MNSDLIRSQNSPPNNNTTLNSSAYSGRNSSTSRLSNSKSQSRLGNPIGSKGSLSNNNFKDYNHNAEDGQVRDSASVKSINSSNINKARLSQQDPANNNSRVVYLREKLK